ncbi:hypothetical protein [Paracoccus litorisediminis]|uniref:Uncharacterized protein n=1 Tax=Paracoccus litorisediminis TaxID=2006130 RepID=A0A844HUJ4_9RHOB|nr:hypothetical protein [Paracoccus litorisediminis]MTH62134.1 hypothetical protein [Paracoccus litorisediminis]
MTGCIVQVWFEPETETPGRRAPFSMIETEMPDFATFCEMVDANRFIGGAILWTRKGEEYNEMIVTRRQPVAFRGEAVLRCQAPLWRFVEQE